MNLIRQRISAGILFSLLLVGCGGAGKPKASDDSGTRAAESRRNVAREISKERRASERAADRSRTSNFASQNEFGAGEEASSEGYRNPGPSSSKSKNDIFMALGTLLAVKVGMSVLAPQLNASDQGPEPQPKPEPTQQETESRPQGTTGAYATTAIQTSVATVQTPVATVQTPVATIQAPVANVQLAGLSDGTSTEETQKEDCDPQNPKGNQASELQNEVERLINVVIKQPTAKAPDSGQTQTEFTGVKK